MWTSPDLHVKGEAQNPCRRDWLRSITEARNVIRSKVWCSEYNQPPDSPLQLHFPSTARLPHLSITMANPGMLQIREA